MSGAWDAVETLPVVTAPPPPPPPPMALDAAAAAPFQALTLRHADDGTDEVHYLKRDGSVLKFRILATHPPYVTFQDLLDGYLSDLLGAQVL